jgi:hypothetical protein
VPEPGLSGSELSANFTPDDSSFTGAIGGNGVGNDVTGLVTIAGNALTIARIERCA